MAVLATKYVLIFVGTIFLSKFSLITGLECKRCSSVNSDKCEGRPVTCGIDQEVCSYVIHNNSREVTTIRQGCEQRRSCENDGGQYANCKTGQCKFCCTKNNCNMNGPKYCSCSIGLCENKIPNSAPILFCSDDNKKILCRTSSSWHALINGKGYYIANKTDREQVISCRTPRVVRGSSNSTVTIKATCSLIVTNLPNSQKNTRIRSRLGSLAYSKSKLRPEMDQIIVQCSHLMLSDYLFDWKCVEQTVDCSFVFIPAPTSMPTPQPTTTEPVKAPAVAAGLDFWVYIIIVGVGLGVLIFVGLSRNIIVAACKKRGNYRVNRVKPRRLLVKEAPLPSTVNH